MSNTRSGLFALTAAAALMGAPNHLHGQESRQALSNSTDVSAMAVDLETQAEELAKETRWKAAAQMYRSAADLRGEGDIKSADNLRVAGYLHYYLGSFQSAISALRAAGESYLALGDVEQAAEAFIDGAWVAGRSGKMSEAHGLRERGVLLTRSPLLDMQNRMALVQRLSRVPVG